MQNDNIITRSIDLHLFFMRIMKEHMFFIEAAFTPQDLGMKRTATRLREQASNLLAKVVAMANGKVSGGTLNANDIVTKYTLDAESATSYYTKIPIDTNITTAEKALTPNSNNALYSDVSSITAINNEALQLVTNIIAFKTKLLSEVLNCSIFTINYPLLIDHILREARYYQNKIIKLQSNDNTMTQQQLVEEEIFWNRIMAEHSKFIRGLLDPTEEELLEISNMFANNFDELTKEATAANNNVYALSGITQKSMTEVMKIQDFKTKGTEGLLNCKVKSIILPLLADHVLREANHYFKLLKLYDAR